MPLALKSNCSIIKDGKSIFLVMNGYRRPLTTKEALFLTLLNGTRSLDEVYDIFLELKIGDEKRRNDTINIIKNNYRLYLTENSIEQTTKKYSPNEFVMAGNNKLSLNRYPVPTALMFIVTINCDKACRYCFVNAPTGISNENLLPYSRVKQLLDEAASMGVGDITYSGGEPFLRHDIFDIMEYAALLGLRNRVTTKHYLNEDQIKRLKQISLLSPLNLSISYDINHNEIASIMVDKKDHALNIDCVVRSLIKNEIDFCVQPVLTGLSFPFFKKFLNYLQDIGVKKAIISRYYKTSGRTDDRFDLKQDQWQEAVGWFNDYHMIVEPFEDLCKDDYRNIKIDEWRDKQGKKERLGKYYGCVETRRTLIIAPDGKAILCNCLPNRTDFVYGDLSKTSIADVWDSEERKAIVIPPRDKFRETNCFNCDSYEDCSLKMACYKNSLEVGNSIYTLLPGITNYCDILKGNM